MHFIFFFNDTATTEIYTLSLHDALPICEGIGGGALQMYIEGRLKQEQLHISPYVDGLEHLLFMEELRVKYDIGLRSEEHTSELQSRQYLVCRLLLEKKKKKNHHTLLFKP